MFVKALRNPLCQALLILTAVEVVAATAGAERTIATTVHEGLLVLLDDNPGTLVSDSVSRSIYGSASLACGSANSCGEWDQEDCEWFAFCRELPGWNFETGQENMKGNGIAAPCGGSCCPLNTNIVPCGVGG